MNRAFCLPVKQGDLINLDFLATNSNYQLELPYYILIYDTKIFTCIKGGVIVPKPIPEYVYFKEKDATPGVDGIYTFLVADNAPVNTTHYINLEGHEENVWSLSERNPPKEKTILYVTIQGSNPHAGSKNESPSVVFETKNAIIIDKQTTKADTHGNPVYIVDASITTTLEEVKKLRLDKIGKQITFHDKDGITRVGVDILPSTNKNIIKSDFTYKDTAQRFFTSREVGFDEEDVKIPFTDINIYTRYKEKIIKPETLIPNHSYLFSSKQWPEVGIKPDAKKSQLPTIRMGQLAPVRITAYDGAGAKTIVNLTFKDKTLGK